MKIEKLMTARVAACRPEDTLHRAAGLMWDHDCGSVPVVDSEQRLLGMLTDRDICMAGYFRGQPLQFMAVGDAMSRGLHTVELDAAPEDALRLMEEHKVRRLPVVDADGRLAGIVALADLVRESGRKGESRGKVKPEQLLGALRAISSPPPREAEVMVVEVRPAARGTAQGTSASGDKAAPEPKGARPAARTAPKPARKQRASKTR